MRPVSNTSPPPQRAGKVRVASNESPNRCCDSQLTKPVTAMAVLAWWVKHRDRLRDGTRYLAGAPRSTGGLLAALTVGPMRRRPALLLGLQLHGVRPRVAPYIPARRQRMQLIGLRHTLEATPLDRPAT